MHSAGRLMDNKEFKLNKLRNMMIWLGKMAIAGGIGITLSVLTSLSFERSKPIDVVSVGDFDGDGKSEVIGVESFVDRTGCKGERLVHYDPSRFIRKTSSVWANGRGEILTPVFIGSNPTNRYWKIDETSYSEGRSSVYVNIGELSTRLDF